MEVLAVSELQSLSGGLSSLLTCPSRPTGTQINAGVRLSKVLLEAFEKYNIDKRRAHLSSLIVSGLITRDEALKELKNPLFKDKMELNNDTMKNNNKSDL